MAPRLLVYTWPYTELPEFGDLMKLKKPRETLVGDTFGVKDTLVVFERDGGRVTRLRLDSVFGYYPLTKKPAGTH